jgi:hypothetical protein
VDAKTEERQLLKDEKRKNPGTFTVDLVGQKFLRKFEGVRGDDWFFGVSSVAPDGSESPIASALPGGAFVPEGKGKP